MRNLFKVTISILATLLLMGIYALTSKGVYRNPDISEVKNNLDQPTQPLELSPERGRFVLTMSIVKNRSFALTEEMADAVYPDVGWHDGKFFILFAPGISLMAVPLYILGSYFNLSQVFSFYLSSLFATANGIIIFVIARRVFRLPIWSSVFASISFCLGSIAWAYAVTLYQHHVTTFLMLSGFYAVWKYRQAQKFSWVYSACVWFFYALALWIDYPNVLLYLPIMIYLGLSGIKFSISQNKYRFTLRISLLLTSIMFIGLSAVHGYYNHVHFGKWSKISGGIIDYKKIKEGGLLESVGGEEKIQEIEDKINPTKYFSEEDFPFGIYTLLVSQDRGLLLYSPLFVLGILGLVHNFKKFTIETAILTTSVCITIFLYSSWSDPWGGWAYGPRYMIPALGMLSPFIAAWLSEKTHSTFRKIIALILFIYSSAIGLLGAITTIGVPKVLDAKLINAHHNFLLNIDFLLKGKNSSFVYNNFLKNYLSLTDFYLYTLLFVVSIAFFVLFILPRITRHDD